MTALKLTASTSEDLVALVPVVLGFTPSDSVAMLTFKADQQFHARADLPRSPADIAKVVATLVEPAVRNGVRQAAFVFYSGDARATARLALALLRELKRNDVAVVDLLRVADGRWYPAIGDPGVRAIGRRFDAKAHPFAAEAVFAGIVSEDSREDVAARLVTQSEQARRVEQALTRLMPWPQSDPPPVADLLREGRWVEELVRGHALASRVPTDEEVARLLRGMQVKRVRDAAWALLKRPEAELYVAFWTDVVRRTPRAWRAPPATLLGWAAWQAGHGALAWCAVEVCAEVEPDYTVMTYLTTLLQHAVAPSSLDVATPGFDWAEGLVGNGHA